MGADRWRRGSAEANVAAPAPAPAKFVKNRRRVCSARIAKRLPLPLWPIVVYRSERDCAGTIQRRERSRDLSFSVPLPDDRIKMAQDL